MCREAAVKWIPISRPVAWVENAACSPIERSRSDDEETVETHHSVQGEGGHRGGGVHGLDVSGARIFFVACFVFPSAVGDVGDVVRERETAGAARATAGRKDAPIFQYVRQWDNRIWAHVPYIHYRVGPGMSVGRVGVADPIASGRDGIVPLWTTSLNELFGRTVPPKDPSLRKRGWEQGVQVGR